MYRKLTCVQIVCTVLNNDALPMCLRLSTVKLLGLFIRRWWSDVASTDLSPWETASCHTRCWKWSPLASIHNWTQGFKLFGDQVALEDLWPTSCPHLTPLYVFHVGLTVRKGLHKQALIHRRPQRKHSPRDCNHYSWHAANCIHQFKAWRKVVHGCQRLPHSTLYVK